MAMTLRTDSAVEAALAFLAEREGLSRQEVVTRAILERAERLGHVDRVDVASRELKVEWAETLDRLGKV